MAVVKFDVFCETVETCKWRRVRVPDKEEAIDIGVQHATTEHPEIEHWRVRVLTRVAAMRCELCGQTGLTEDMLVDHFKQKHPLVYEQVKATIGSDRWLN